MHYSASDCRSPQALQHSLQLPCVPTEWVRDAVSSNSDLYLRHLGAIGTQAPPNGLNAYEALQKRASIAGLLANSASVRKTCPSGATWARDFLLNEAFIAERTSKIAWQIKVGQRGDASAALATTARAVCEWALTSPSNTDLVVPILLAMATGEPGSLQNHQVYLELQKVPTARGDVLRLAVADSFLASILGAAPHHKPGRIRVPAWQSAVPTVALREPQMLDAFHTIAHVVVGSPAALAANLSRFTAATRPTHRWA